MFSKMLSLLNKTGEIIEYLHYNTINELRTRFNKRIKIRLHIVKRTDGSNRVVLY